MLYRKILVVLVISVLYITIEKYSVNCIGNTQIDFSKGLIVFAGIVFGRNIGGLVGIVSGILDALTGNMFSILVLPILGYISGLLNKNQVVSACSIILLYIIPFSFRFSVEIFYAIFLYIVYINIIVSLYLFSFG